VGGYANMFFQTQAHWPEEELEWMATTAYDHGIDCYSRSQDDAAKRWIMAAIGLAHYRQDGRQLENIMQEKYLTLKFDVVED
jgi:hypothetical protein